MGIYTKLVTRIFIGLDGLYHQLTLAIQSYTLCPICTPCTIPVKHHLCQHLDELFNALTLICSCQICSPEVSSKAERLIALFFRHLISDDCFLHVSLNKMSYSVIRNNKVIYHHYMQVWVETVDMNPRGGQYL